MLDSIKPSCVEPNEIHDNNNNEILALMFCEFDNHEGPKILYQKPYEIINKTTFETIIPYIIPKVQLKNRIITITVNNKYRVCGYPIYIENNKYNRNQYIFNICCIFSIHTNTCSYEALVKKLASDLRILEVECSFLSTFKMKEHLPKLLEQIHSNLNSSGECIIQKIGNLDHSSMFLKLIKDHVDPQIVQSFDVPVFIVDPESFEIDDWDLTTKKVVASINGFKTISMIANDTKIEIDVVKEAIQNLLYADVLILVPIIQNSSMFVVNSNIVHYYSNQNMQAESIQFIRLDKDKDGPVFYDLFFFYNLFKNGVTIRNITEMYNPIEKNIDIK
jgi:nitrogen permease regulator 2-like protein